MKDILFTVSICLNVFQTIVFWFWTILICAAWKDMKNKLNKLEGEEE